MMQFTENEEMSRIAARYEVLFTAPGGADLFVRPAVPRGAWLHALLSVGAEPRGVEVVDADRVMEGVVPIEELKVYCEFRRVDQGGDFAQYARVVWHGAHSLGIALVRAVVATTPAVVCIPSGERGAGGVEEALVAFPSASGFGSEVPVRNAVDDGAVTWGVAVVLEPGEGDEFRLQRKPIAMIDRA